MMGLRIDFTVLHLDGLKEQFTYLVASFIDPAQNEQHTDDSEENGYCRDEYLRDAASDRSYAGM
jgi:hypothetical protein